MQTKKIKVIYIVVGIVLLSIIYLAIWIYNDIPPTINAKFPTVEDYNFKNFSEDENNKMSEAMNKLNMIERICVAKYLQARNRKFSESCDKRGFKSSEKLCNSSFDGVYIPIDNFNSLEYCKIDWR